MKCIHPPDRLSVIPSELAPLFDVIPVGVEVQADKVFNQSRCAHALSSEVAYNPVQLVTYRLADEHGLAVDNLGDLQVGGAVLLQRQPALLAADAFPRHCRFPGTLSDGSSTIAVSASSVTVLQGCSGLSGFRPMLR